MCGGPGTSAYNSAANVQKHASPEQRISQIIMEEARSYIDPAVIRLIVKYRWDELSKAAHQIHGSAS